MENANNCKERETYFCMRKDILLSILICFAFCTLSDAQGWVSRSDESRLELPAIKKMYKESLKERHLSAGILM